MGKGKKNKSAGDTDDDMRTEWCSRALVLSLSSFMWRGQEGVVLYLTSVRDFVVMNPVWLPEDFLILFLVLPSKESTNMMMIYIYRILFHYVANNDIQIYWYTTFTVRVCAFVSVCVCVCKESSETTESRMKIPWGSPQWVNKAEIASKRALGDSLGRHTHTQTSKGEQTFSSVKHTFAMGCVPVLSAA